MRSFRTARRGVENPALAARLVGSHNPARVAEFVKFLDSRAATAEARAAGINQ